MRTKRLAAILLALSALLSLTAFAASTSYRIYLPTLIDPREPATATATTPATATSIATATSTATATVTVTNAATTTSTATATVTNAATTTTTATTTATSTATTTATSTATSTATTTPTATPTATPTTTPTVTSAAELAGRVALRPEYANVTEVGGISTCAPRFDLLDGKPEFRSTIPADQFQSVGGLVYPTVGEVFLENEADQTSWQIPIYAGPAAELSYRKVDLPPGSYRLQAYIFYRHPLDPPGQSPRSYSLIWQGGGNAVDSLTVLVAAGQDVRLDLKLLLFGDVCAQRP